MELILPYPPAIINKNSRAHWAKIASITKRAKVIAFNQTLRQLENGVMIPKTPWQLVVNVFPKDKRRRDLDNISVKPYLDGLISAMNFFEDANADDNMLFIPEIEMKYAGIDPAGKGFICLRLLAGKGTNGIL